MKTFIFDLKRRSSLFWCKIFIKRSLKIFFVGMFENLKPIEEKQFCFVFIVIIFSSQQVCCLNVKGDILAFLYIFANK